MKSTLFSSSSAVLDGCRFGRPLCQKTAARCCSAVTMGQSGDLIGALNDVNSFSFGVSVDMQRCNQHVAGRLYLSPICLFPNLMPEPSSKHHSTSFVPVHTTAFCTQKRTCRTKAVLLPRIILATGHRSSARPSAAGPCQPPLSGQ
jgi:hypothetical protein